MAWSGFSEEQIRRMQDTASEEDDSLKKTTHGPRTSSKRGRSSGNRGRAPPTVKKATKHVGREPSLPDNQKLSLSSEPESEAWEALKIHTKKTSLNGDSRATVKSTSEADVTSKADDKETSEKPLQEKDAELKILDEDEGKKRELTKLQLLQDEQKKIEEENKKKKAMLFQALENRKKKTQEEAKRLAFVQKELSKIENLLTSDVTILRDKIEEASRNYAEAEKRYQNAEKEFVAAKIYLHKMEEKKEALTEHLFAIIHQNELRKSKKLEELVSSLDTSDITAFLADKQPIQVISSNSKTNQVEPLESQEVDKDTKKNSLSGPVGLSQTDPVDSNDFENTTDATKLTVLSQNEEQKTENSVTAENESPSNVPKESVSNQSKEVEPTKNES